jgi:site-specific DNA recombinase
MSKERCSGSTPGPIRCAIYTRKSTTEGLDSGFSTLDAQREACELYIRSQAAQGWEVVPDRYDDGGFTGGNLDRPALERLLEEIDRGFVGMVVVYKLDRLSRSLLDFTRLMERFEKKQVGFVSTTQQFDTSGSMGRLTLNILLSFAQFEREIISERTRDKIQAARKRGRWTGGRVVLGYNLDPERRGLRIVPQEARLVRQAFDLYLRTRSILEVARRLNALGPRSRPPVRGAASRSGGRAWDKNSVHRLLRNPLYAGKTRSADGSLHAGDHEAIVSIEVFGKVQEGLDIRTTGPTRTSRSGDYLLTGILRCGPCAAAMTSSASKGRGGKVYRFYRCCKLQGQGIHCPTGLLPVQEVEQAVIGQVRDIARQSELRERVLSHVAAGEQEKARIEDAREGVRRDLNALGAEAKRLMSAFQESDSGGRLIAGRLGEIETLMDSLREEETKLRQQGDLIGEGHSQTERALSLLDAFDAVWQALVPVERRKLLHLLVRQVTVDLDNGGLRVALHDLLAPEVPQEVVA